MNLRLKKVGLVASIFTLISIPLIAKAYVPPEIIDYGTTKSGIITTYSYAWTGTNGCWARTTENLYYITNGSYAGQLSSAYSATGWAQTEQKSYGIALSERTTHTASGNLVEYSE